MYRLTNRSLADSANEHKKNSGLTFDDEINFLRALIEETANECETSSEALSKLSGPLGTVVSAIEKLHKLEIAQSYLLSKDALHLLAQQLIEILTDSMELIEDKALRARVVDYAASRMGSAIDSAKNPTSEIKRVGFYNDK